MTPEEFFLKYNGIGLDFDGAYGFQCVDVFKAFNKEVVAAPNVSGNAIDYWSNFPTNFYDKIEYSVSKIPEEGDVMIWGTGLGQYGHIAICFKGDMSHFISFDQNYPIGSLCHFQNHNYNNLLGWLRPKNLPKPEPKITDQTKIDLGELGVMEVQQIKSTIKDLQRDLANTRTQLGELQTQLGILKESQGTVVYANPIEPTFKTRLANLLYQIAKRLG